MTRPCLALALGALAPLLFQELLPERVLEVELSPDDPALDGHGPARAFEYEVTFDGLLYVWAASADFDPMLRIESAEGDLLAQDDDSGGGTTACIALPVSRSGLLSITVAAARPGRFGGVALHVAEAPETEETRAASERVGRELSEVARLEAAGEVDAARALMEALAGRIVALQDAKRSPALIERAGRAAVVATAMGLLRPTEELERLVLDHRSRVLPTDHADLQRARLNLAVTEFSLGDLTGARELFEQVLEVFSRTLPDEHPDLQATRMNLAAAMRTLGDLESSRNLLQRALEICLRTLPEEHPYVRGAMLNLAATLHLLGDFGGAQALFEQVLEISSESLPEEHPHLQAARGNLALAIKELGDLQGARALEEVVLEVFARTLPSEHPELQQARGNLAVTLKLLGEHGAALVLEEEQIEVMSRILPEEHPHLQQARTNLATTKFAFGDFEGAQALIEKVLEVLSRTMPDEDSSVQHARANLAVILATRAILPEDSAEAAGRVGTRAEETARCAELLCAYARAKTRAARQALLSSAAREAGARCEELASGLDLTLSMGAGYGALEPNPEVERASFVLSETTRGASVSAAALRRRAAGSPAYLELREELRALSEELAGIVQRGSPIEAFRAALTRRETVERELAELAETLTGGAAGLEFDPVALSAILSEQDAVVGLRRYARSTRRRGDAPGAFGVPAETTVESLCAWVLRPGGESGEGRLTRVELGAVEAIEAAVKSWREGLGVAREARGLPVATLERVASEREVAERGRVLRRLALDPLSPALAGAERVIIALDDVLHLVPLDALPLDEGEECELVGDRLRIETRVTLAELLAPVPASADEGGLVAVGGVEYGARESAGGDAPAPARMDADAGVLRGGAWSAGFASLPATALEAEAIASAFRRQRGGEAAVTLLDGTDATRARLLELAPRARWLHVATHGWFASESIRSWQDPEPLDRYTGLGTRRSGEEQVRGMSPMLLCGLALSGANLPEDELGRMPGLITAEEIAALDLGACELAVLSACDTNVGERRAGQGVASLQMALQMAGARSAITSLWAVPDEATRELMIEFYRRLWIEGEPRGRALWQAKRKLRDAQDEAGRPRYMTRDWAAWVLTGEPQ